MLATDGLFKYSLAPSSAAAFDGPVLHAALELSLLPKLAPSMAPDVHVILLAHANGEDLARAAPLSLLRNILQKIRRQ